MSHYRKARTREASTGYYNTIATGGNGRGCRGKVRHPKRKQALGAMNRHLAENPDDPKLIALGVYPCPDCGGWHVGHRPTT